MTAARQPRRSRDDLRRTLLAEGRQILLEEGLDTGSSNLTFKRVFERVEMKTGVRITNASVIRRVWENQSEFQSDVLVAIAEDEARPEVGGAVDAVAAALAEFDLSTPESRSGAVREVCRIGGNASSSAIAESTNWTLWINVIAMATATATPDQQRRIRSALAELGYHSVSNSGTTTTPHSWRYWGSRLRHPSTMSEFTMAVTAYSEGTVSLRQRSTDDVELMVRPTGEDGKDQEWSLFAVGLEALVQQFSSRIRIFQCLQAEPVAVASSLKFEVDQSPMAVLSDRRDRRRREKLADAARVAGPGVEVTGYGSGIGHSRIAGWPIYLVIGFIIAFVVAHTVPGEIFCLGVVLVLIGAVSSIRPHRSIAVTSIGILIMHESMTDGRPDRVLSHMAPPYALGPLDEGLEWKRYVLVHVGPERISMRRTVYQSLLVAVDHLSTASGRDGPHPVPSNPPPGWFRDPLARYQYRYWDGRGWTANVSHNGMAYLDSSV